MAAASADTARVASEPPDNAFALVRAELRAGFEGLRKELQAALAVTEAGIRQDLAATAAGIRQDLAASEARLGEQIATSQAETRRHMGVIAEELTGKIELVIEGVRAVDERLERFRSEVDRDFQKVDRRFLHLVARIHGRP